MTRRRSFFDNNKIVSPVGCFGLGHCVLNVKNQSVGPPSGLRLARLMAYGSTRTKMPANSFVIMRHSIITAVLHRWSAGHSCVRGFPA